jgi:hypothetical protein
LAKNDSVETGKERAFAKLEEIWPLLEVMEVTPSEGEFHRSTVRVMVILKDIREILGTEIEKFFG